MYDISVTTTRKARSLLKTQKNFCHTRDSKMEKLSYNYLIQPTVSKL